mmetsp:Transcript_21367/g.61278  ORF Transcript_21367/g.61278 Transcript_21367/m.61278 type:complete len:227 (+) Transcript_21367:996-1676(+)
MSRLRRSQYRMRSASSCLPRRPRQRARSLRRTGGSVERSRSGRTLAAGQLRKRRSLLRYKPPSSDSLPFPSPSETLEDSSASCRSAMTPSKSRNASSSWRSAMRSSVALSEGRASKAFSSSASTVEACLPVDIPTAESRYVTARARPDVKGSGAAPSSFNLLLASTVDASRGRDGLADFRRSITRRGLDGWASGSLFATVASHCFSLCGCADVKIVRARRGFCSRS